STWLAPVRPREDGGVAKDRPAQPEDAPTHEAAAQPGRKASRLDHDLAHTALPVLGFMSAKPQAVPTPFATPFTEPPGLATPMDSAGSTPATPAVTMAPAGPGAPAAALPTAGPRPMAPVRAASSAAPRSAPPARMGESQPFAPTNLQVTAGDDGPAVWLRDARLNADGHTAARLLQALATLGWTQSLRPGALFLNGRRLPEPSERLPAAATSARPAALPDPLPSPKEDSHGH
ncbi:MAG TPA: hypothetical protein VFL86_01490, partial [Burkholderiaceae bacterium]|nr:hypothetical protein [Burkholderiaceae bacterium]